MKTDILIAGHGGQGVLELGNYIAYHAMMEGRHVAYTPSYGPETRGGRVRCYVVISDGEIDSPIAEEPDVLIVMNLPSMDFEPVLKPGGLLVMNSSLIDRAPSRRDVRVVKVPATEIADRLRNELDAGELQGITDTRIAGNCVVFGTYIALKGLRFDKEQLAKMLEFFFAGKKSVYIPVNLAAMERGFSFAKTLEPQKAEAPRTG